VQDLSAEPATDAKAEAKAAEGEAPTAEGEAPAAEAAAEGEAPAAAEAPDPGAREFVPLITGPSTEGHAEKLEALKAEEAALRAKLEAGDIDIAAYDAEKTRIIEARADIRADERLAEFAAQQNEANQKARWQWEQENFFAAESNAIYKDPLLFAALNAAVVAAANDPANSKRSASWFLTQADEQVRKLIAPAAPVASAAPAKAEAPAIRAVPKTLAALPAAALPEAGAADEFARLERLSGLELERQLARMSPEEVDRYLRAA
jgi:hypothetical protein